MNIRQMIWAAANCRETNIAYIAEELGVDRSNLHKRINRGTLRNDDLAKIAKILGGEYIYYISFPDDIKIGKLPADRKKRRV